MLEHFRPGGPLALELAWQSTAALILGGSASVALARRPARAHGVLVLAMLAGLLTPLLGQGARWFGWGLLPERVGAAATGRATVAETVSRPRPDPLRPGPERIPRLDRPEPAAADVPSPGDAPRAVGTEPTSPWLADVPWARVAVGAWLVLAATLLARLALSLVPGLHLVARSSPIDGGAIASAADAARRRLGLRVVPRVMVSEHIRCPLIWCWGSRPILLVPAATLEGPGPVDWEAVLTHELAHWKRHDHLANLLGELACCLLPWNPLAWWARARLGGLSELACDDWVIASGQSATDYAESLLGLVPQRRTAFALAAVSGRIGLADRVRRILDHRRRDPTPGPTWTALAALATALVAAMTALAQVPAGRDNDGTKPAIQDTNSTSPHKAPRTHTVGGIILGPDGEPAAGATIWWIGYRRFERGQMAQPRGTKVRPDDSLKLLARATSGADGRFALEAEFDPETYPGQSVVVRAAGAGLSGRFFFDGAEGGKDIPKDLTLRLRPAATIEGRLLTPAGAPAAGVKVLLEDFDEMLGDEMESEGVNGGEVDQPEASRPEYWPAPRMTDADGRFRIEGVVPERMFARLHFRHADFADEDLFVSTGLPPTDWIRAFNVKPVEARFAHTLEPARPVSGVVSDKETSKPLAGVLVEMIPMRRRYGGSRRVSVRTDADGRFRAAGEAGDSYYVTAYPASDSGYIPLKQDQRWPAGTKVLEVDLALPKGRILRGRVVESGTGRPVAGASVVYEPGRGNPHNRGDYEFRSPVLTDDEGRYALTVLPGDGLLAVEAPTPDFIRMPLTGPRSNLSEISRPHGFARADVPIGKDEEIPEVLIPIRRGVRLEARVVGPDGRPADGVMGWCVELMASQLDNWTSPQPFPGGGFRLDGADPERVYRVFFVHAKRRLGALAELKYDPSGPVEVRLQPAATAKGVVVDVKGRPVEGVQILPWVTLTAEGRELQPEDFSNHELATGHTSFTSEPLLPSYAPEFTYDTLIPGVRYYVGAGGSYHPIPILKPGEVRDLGEIVSKKREPK